MTLVPLKLPVCDCCGQQRFEAHIYRELQWDMLICHECVQAVAKWFYLEESKLGDFHPICQALVDNGSNPESNQYSLYIPSINGPGNSFSSVSFYRLKKISEKST